MFSGEEVIKRLETIRIELGFAPELGEVEPNEIILSLAKYAGRADTVLDVVNRMVCRLILDIQDEIAKDEKKAEEDRKWLEEWKAKEAAKAQDEPEEVPDAE